MRVNASFQHFVRCEIDKSMGLRRSWTVNDGLSADFATSRAKSDSLVRRAKLAGAMFRGFTWRRL